jgi:hypothetical protein
MALIKYIWVGARLQVDSLVFTGAMDAAEKDSRGFYAASNNPAITTRAPGCNLVKGTLDCVQDLGFAAEPEFERLIIFITAYFTYSHYGYSFVYTISTFKLGVNAGRNLRILINVIVAFLLSVKS